MFGDFEAAAKYQAIREFNPVSATGKEIT